MTSDSEHLQQVKNVTALSVLAQVSLSAQAANHLGRPQILNASVKSLRPHCSRVKPAG